MVSRFYVRIFKYNKNKEYGKVKCRAIEGIS